MKLSKVLITEYRLFMKIAAITKIMAISLQNKSFMMSMRNLSKGSNYILIQSRHDVGARSEEGQGQLEYDHHSNLELELLTNDGHPDPEDLDLFTFNNAELYVTEPGDNADFDQFTFEVCPNQLYNETCAVVHFPDVPGKEFCWP